jgi:2'-5' RNA ligase
MFPADWRHMTLLYIGELSAINASTLARSFGDEGSTEELVLEHEFSFQALEGRRTTLAVTIPKVEQVIGMKDKAARVCTSLGIHPVEIRVPWLPHVSLGYVKSLKNEVEALTVRSLIRLEPMKLYQTEYRLAECHA